MEFFKEGLGWSKRKIKEFKLPESKIIEVLSTDSVDSAFRKLIENKILSAPCWDETEQKYLGFFDITDALALIYSVDLLITAIPDNMLVHQTAIRLATSGSACPSAQELLVGAIFENGSAEDKSRSPVDTCWNPITEEAQMSQVIFLLATSTRRVPVIDAKNKRVTKILSQSLVTNILNECLKEMESEKLELPELFLKTPRTSGFGLMKILSVDSDHETASDAFRKIIENGVSAIGVLDDDKKLLSSITTKNIRLFNSIEEVALQRLSAEQRKRDNSIDEDVPKDHHALMDLTSGDFVSMIEQTENNTGTTTAPVVIVQEDTPIRKIISRLALTKKHRVWVCDPFRHPKGVISVSDVCKLLVTDPKKHTD